MAADGPTRIEREVAGDDAIRATLAGTRAFLGRRGTGPRPALAVDATVSSTARGRRRPAAAECAIGATDRFADVVDAFVPLAAVVGDGALPERLAADATGAHPYLSLGVDSVDDLTVELPAACYYPTDVRGIPTGRESVDRTTFDLRTPAPLGDRVLDNAFTELSPGPDGGSSVRLVNDTSHL